ncbi:caspase, EACC1-associated type [Streptomyces sp. NPDC001142]
MVVGTAVHSSPSAPPDLPSVGATARDLADALREVCGMDPAQITLVVDPPDEGTVMEAVEEAVGQARGLVLFAYIGHGLLGPQDQLYLATSASSSSGIARSVPYQSIRDTLSASNARTAVLLDCCFSGLADAASRGSLGDPYVSARPAGSFLLTSASNYAVSFAPKGQRHTLFTGKLLTLLREGDPAAPALLTLDGVYAHLDRIFQDGPVRPHRQSEDRAGDLVVAANRAYSAGPAAQEAPPHPADGIFCPYPGMEPFRPEDHERFFGRDMLIAELIQAVTEPTNPTNGMGRGPVVLVGASGVGKSSILRAGLLAGLERRYEANPVTPWPALLLASPGPRPLRALATLWAEASGRPREKIERQLGEGRLPDGDCQVLVVDQFEEVFTRCQDHEERTGFVRALCTGAGSGGPRVVLGLRADHYGSCLDHPPLMRALDKGQLIVPPMDEQGLRAAIEGPAHDAGLRLAPGLCDLLLRDTQEGGGRDLGSALPFLAHALRQTWVRREGATLTLSGYADTGGIWESVASTADEIYESLDGPGRDHLRELLLSMVTLAGSTDEPVRRRIGLDEPVEGRSRKQRARMVSVRDRLARARLITVDRNAVQISHEALLRAWPRLHRWIDEDRAGLVTRQQLADAADAWDSAGRESAYCYYGTRLAALTEWLGEKRHGRLLRPLDHEFVAASREFDNDERERERRQLEVERRQARRLRFQARRLKQLLGAAAALLCMALIATGIALQQRSNARDSGQMAQNRQLQAAARASVGTDPKSALLQAVAAFRGDPSPQSRATLLDVLSGMQYAGSVDATRNMVDSLAYGDDGRTLAVGDGLGVVGLWDTSRPGEPRQLAEVVAKNSGFNGDPAAWIGDGRSLLLTGADDEASLGRFSLADPSHPRPLGRMPLPMQGAMEESEFSPDGRMLVTSNGWETTLWSVEPGRGAGRSRASIPQRKSNVQAAAFGPDGKLLTLGLQNGTVELWNVQDPDRPRSIGVLEGTGGPVRALTISRDGRTLAAASSDAQVRLWNVARPSEARRIAVISGHDGPVTAVALSRDGRLLAAGSTDHTATLWDISQARPVRSAVFTGHNNTVSALAFSPDSRTLASGDNDGSVFFWSLRDRLAPTVTGRPFTSPAPDYYWYFESGTPNALTPDGDLLALVTAERQLSLVPLTGPSAGRRAGTIQTDAPVSLAWNGHWFSADGARLAAETPEGTVTVWNVKDPAHPVREFQLKAAPSGTRVSVAFSESGSLMAVGANRTATLWDLSRPDRPRRLGTVKAGRAIIPNVMFDPKGRILAVGTTLYDVTDPRAPSRLSELPHPDEDKGPLHATPQTFSPDGRTLALTAGSGVLFDVSDPRKPRFLSYLRNSNNMGTGPYSFSQDGRLLAGPGSGAQVLTWDVSDPAAPHPVTSLTLDDQAWSLTLSSDGKVLTTYDATDTATRWNIEQLSATLRDPVARACRLAGANPTAAEWKQIAPGVPFQRVCPSLAAAPTPRALPIFPVFSTPVPAGK